MSDGLQLENLSKELMEEKLRKFKKKYGAESSANALMINRNTKNLTDLRVLTTIFIGIAAGILGFDGPLGIVFYFAMDYVVSILLILRFGFKARPFFQNLKQIFKAGLTTNVMSFMVTWVLVHNLVYIL